MYKIINERGQAVWRAPSFKEYALPDDYLGLDIIQVLKKLKVDGLWITREMIKNELDL